MGEPTRVLLVQDQHDDIELIRSFCLTAVPRLHFTVARNRAACWEMFAAQELRPFDVLVIDDALSDSNGLTLLHEIVDSGYPAPVIVITERTDVETAVATMKEGAIDYLVKTGAYWRHLPNIIDSALSRYQLFRENQRLHGNLSRYAAQLESSVQQVQLEKERLQVVLEHLPEGVLVVNGGDGKTVTANSAAERLWGHPFVPGVRIHSDDTDDTNREQHHYLENLDGTPLLLEDRPIVRVLRSGQPVLGEQVIMVQPGGKRITILVNAAPLLNQWGEVLGAVAVFQDISEIKRLEQLKDDVLSIASHELKNPLTVLKGYISLLAKAPPLQSDPRLYRIARIIHHQSERMEQLVGRLLDLSRLDLGTMTLSLSSVDLVPLLWHVVEQQQATARNHRLHLRTAPASLVLQGDYIRLEQVLVNVISNAIKYSPEGGVIELQLQREEELILDHFTCGSPLIAPGPYALIKVRDYGIGIAPEMQQQLFNRFYRVREAARLAAGQGLGLYICAEIVRMHGGVLCVESAVGRGSTFRIVLPLCSDEGAGICNE